MVSWHLILGLGPEIPPLAYLAARWLPAIPIWMAGVFLDCFTLLLKVLFDPFPIFTSLE